MLSILSPRWLKYRDLAESVNIVKNSIWTRTLVVTKIYDAAIYGALGRRYLE